MNGTDKTDKINSVVTASVVLTVVVQARKALSLKEVCEETGMLPAKAHRYLQTLCDCGFLVQSKATKRYDLGKFSLEVGTAAISRIDVLDWIAQDVPGLSIALDADVALAIWSVAGPIIIRLHTRAVNSRYGIGVGATRPLLSSSIGRVFLAWMKQDETWDVLDAEWKDAAGNQAQGVDELRRETRVLGYSFNDGGYNPNIGSIAVPIFNIQGEIVASVMAAGQLSDFRTRKFEIVEELFSFCVEHGSRHPRQPDLGGLPSVNSAEPNDKGLRQAS